MAHTLRSTRTTNTFQRWAAWLFNLSARASQHYGYPSADACASAAAPPSSIWCRVDKCAYACTHMRMVVTAILIPKDWLAVHRMLVAQEQRQTLHQIITTGPASLKLHCRSQLSHVRRTVRRDSLLSVDRERTICMDINYVDHHLHAATLIMWNSELTTQGEQASMKCGCLGRATPAWQQVNPVTLGTHHTGFKLACCFIVDISCTAPCA